MKEQNNKTRIVGVRFTPHEFKSIEAKWKRSIYKKLSGYLRNIILEKPVTMNYRNQSMDDFMAELIRLRGELKSIANNFNQLVKRINSFQSEESIIEALQAWEMDRKKFLTQVENIQLFIDVQAKKW